MPIDPSLYEGYIGSNKAHKEFKQEIVNAKVLYYQIQGSRNSLREYFDKQVKEARRSAQGPFSVGLVMEVLSQTQFRMLNIPHNEADLVFSNYDSLEGQFYSLLYMDLQRILESFLLDLFAEIARKEPKVLISKRTVTAEDVLKSTDIVSLLLDKELLALSHSDLDGFERRFEEVGLPLVNPDLSESQKEFVAFESMFLWAARNVLQHNHGMVNDLFLKKLSTTNYNLGDRIMIDTPKLGRAFAVVEVIADGLNQRAVTKFDMA